jgi:microcin C transport system ATP-binding protein
VREIIGEGLSVHDKGLTAQQIDQRVTEVLAEVGLEKYAAERYPHEFSGDNVSVLRLLEHWY